MRTEVKDRRNYQGCHILTGDYSVSTDTWESGLNNNVDNSFYDIAK